MFDIEETMKKRLEQFDRIDAKTRSVFANKNRQYQDAIKDTGVLGASVELVGLAGRLKALVLRNSTHGQDDQEALANALLDTINYGHIALMMLEDENWEGE